MSKQNDAQITELSDLLKTYYRHHYSPENLFRLISEKSFRRREFGFDILGSHFVRNRSFQKPEHLKEYLYTFSVAGAYLGGEYSSPLRAKRGKREAITIHDAEWVGRELIFDLDINEYDPVRTCGCKGKNACNICWGLLQDASRIIDETLREDFGFEQIYWLFTGGRGYHCWVTDPKAFVLDHEQRAGIVGYMQLIHDPLGEQRVEDISINGEQLRKRIFRILAQKFILEAPSSAFEEIGIKKKALETLRAKAIAFEQLDNYYSIIPSKAKDSFLPQLIKYRYPRIDHKVTIDVKRLIRLPESVHIRTKLLCQFVKDPSEFMLEEAKSLEDIVS